MGASNWPWIFLRVIVGIGTRSWRKFKEYLAVGTDVCVFWWLEKSAPSRVALYICVDSFANSFH